jgi:hypothetical protein
MRITDSINGSAGKSTPDEFTLEFGLSAQGKKKLLIVEGSLGGHFIIIAEWKAKDADYLFLKFNLNKKK